MSQQVAQASSDLSLLSVSSAGAQLGLSFMRDISRSKTENVVISPISIQIILNMILLGADLNSQTEQELIKHIGYEKTSDKPANKDEPHEGMRQISELLAKSVSTSAGLKFDLANLMLFVEQLTPDYTKSVEKFYRNTRFEKVSRETKATDLKQRVNSWVASATNNHITNLADNLNVDDSLLMILVNAAYFQGEWMHQFDAKKTTEQTFYNHGLATQSKKVKFMQRSGSFKSIDLTPMGGHESGQRDEGLSEAESEFLKLANKLDCRVISLPFSANGGKELDMIIMLPNKRDGLNSLWGNLSASDLRRVFNEIDSERSVKTWVEIPKFSFETMFDVKSALQAMGVNRVFSRSAELKRMFPNHPALVDQILHKAKISVDEKGAVAEAATVATVTMRSGSWPPRLPFKADHPFLFVIRHKPSGMATFLGSVVQL